MGDTIIEADDKKIVSRQDWLDYAIKAKGKADSMDQQITLLKVDGTQTQVAARDVWDPIEGKLYFDTSEDGVVNSLKAPKTHTPLALIEEKGLSVIASLGMWNTKPQIIEVEIEEDAHANCTTCQVNSISLYSTQIARNLPIVNPVAAGRIIYPVLNAEVNPGAYVPVPSPDVVGYNSNTYTNGTINGFGNNYNLSSNSVTSMHPVYDYSQTNAANFANSITKIENNNAQEQSHYRVQYVNSHMPGTLSNGLFSPKEKRHGVLLFENVGDGIGPYELRIDRVGHPITIIFYQE